MIVPFPDQVPPAQRLGRVHLVGIGGAGLSGIARLLLARGVSVSGCDACDSATLASLKALGAVCHVGHDGAHVAGVDTVVVSTAVREGNPDVTAARRAGLRLWPRSAAMVSVMAGHTVLAVAGTHGKTTTTALLAVALRAAGADPSYAIGADLSATGDNARVGSGALFVAEADESDGSFLAYRPHGAVVPNVDSDHLDSYGSERAYRRAFVTFLERIDPGGFLVVGADDPGAAALADRAAARGLTVARTGTGPGSDLRGVEERLSASGSEVTVLRGGKTLGRLRLQVPGRHFVLDALAALGAGLLIGHEFADLAGGMAEFSGTRRRMERKGRAAGVTVFDSYAHHPVEITADLDAARQVAGDGRVVVCFQPHLVSRTRVFGAAMGQALSAADVAVVTDVYAAREDPDTAVTGALVADAVGLPPAVVRYEPDLDELPGVLAQLARPGDLVLTLGAGDVTDVGPQLLRRLRLLERGSAGG